MSRSALSQGRLRYIANAAFAEARFKGDDESYVVQYIEVRWQQERMAGMACALPW